MTNFDKLIVEIETDGSITPQDAFEKSADILVDHFSVLAGSVFSAPVAEPVVVNDEVAEEVVTPATDEPKAKKTATKPKTTKTKTVKKG